MIDSYEGNDFNSFKMNKTNSNMKMRSMLINERFLITVIKVLSSDLNIERRYLNNLTKFINSLDKKFYSTDNRISGLLLTIEHLLNSRLKIGKSDNIQSILSKLDIILVDNYEDIKNDIILPTIQLSKSDNNESELEFINISIENNLKYHNVLHKQEELTSIANEISSCSYTEVPNLMTVFRKVLTEIYDFFKDTDISGSQSKILNTSDPMFLDKLKETYRTIKNPETSLKTGLKMFNDMLGPRNGFLNGKYYMIYANTNSFKSALLLHIVRWLQKYNTDSFTEMTRLTGKIPTILFASYENTQDDDLERLFKSVVMNDIAHYENEVSVTSIWEENFNKNNGNINISLLHEESHTDKVSDINNTCDALEDNGYKVVAIVIDYLELLKPEDEDKNAERRIQLGKTSERLLNLAKTRKVPVITAAQLNRAGGAALVGAKESGIKNAVMVLNNNFIGESYNIEKPVDFSMFIDLEMSDDNKRKFLTSKRNKHRGKQHIGTAYMVNELIDGIIIEDDLGTDGIKSLQSIPDNNGYTTDVFNTKVESVGNRGSYNVRQNNNAIQLNNEITIKPSEVEENDSILSKIVTLSNWWKFVEDEYTMNEICDIQNFSRDDYETIKVDDIEYIIHDDKE